MAAFAAITNWSYVRLSVLQHGVGTSLTRDFRETVKARAERDPAFRAGLYAEAVQAFLDGDLATAKILLRDFINATVGFARLRRRIGVPEKSLMCMHHRCPGAPRGWTGAPRPEPYSRNGTTYGPSGITATAGSPCRAMLSATAASTDGISSTPVIRRSSASRPVV
jgi:hypothetical protein